MNTFLDRAAEGLKHHIPVIPALPRDKKTVIGAKAATTDPTIVGQWNAENPDANSALVAQAKVGGVWILDCDSSEVREQFEKDTGKPFPDTFAVRSSKGGHRYFRQNEESLTRLKNFSILRDGKEFFSVRWDNQYCIGSLSVHPSGAIYTTVSDIDPVEAPASLIDWLLEQDRRYNSPSPTPNGVDEGAPIQQGRRNTTITSRLGKIHHAAGGASYETLLAAAKDINQNCEPPLSNSELETISNSVSKYPVKVDEFKERMELRALEAKQRSNTALVSAIPVLEEDKEPWKRYGMTEQEYDAEMDKDYPVLQLPEQAGPTWDDEIIYGVAGKIVKKASAYCEAHPAGMYLDLLVSMGSIFGRQPYFTIKPTNHYANEFVARVGATSIARKGTGQNAINEIIRIVDEKWYRDRVMSGFGSAQAIVNEIRDPFVQKIKVGKKDETRFKEITVPGVDDKRLFIREGELAHVFEQANAKDSKVDVILRLGWDGMPLDNIVKGKGNDGISNSVRCSEPHISISADTTRSELIAKMPTGSDQNGFGNRFLYCYVYRTKLCPHGSPDIDFSAEIMHLLEVIEFAKHVKHVGLSKAAHKMWARMYDEMERTRPAGVVGLMTARGPAHVRRLALILALLDMCDEVQVWHLKAAKKLWDYCEESTQYIFSDYTKEQQRILNWVESRQAVTVTQIREHLFKRNKKADWIQSQVEELARHGYLSVSGDQIQYKKREA
jgi:hypothetical protein